MSICPFVMIFADQSLNRWNDWSKVGLVNLWKIHFLRLQIAGF